MINGSATYPGVPIVIGIFSIVFNIFNVLILFPFVNVFDQVLSRVGRSSEEDVEDYSIPRYLDRKLIDDFNAALPAVEQEAHRQLQAGAVFLDIARGKPGAPKDPVEHHAAIDQLGREIRSFSAHLFQDGLSKDQLDLVASLIEEVDFTSALSESLYQIARRVKREPFSDAARDVLALGLERLDLGMNTVLFADEAQPRMPAGHSVVPGVEELRWKALQSRDVAAGEKGALVALLGSIERAEGLIERLRAERASVDRSAILRPRAASGERPPAQTPSPSGFAPGEAPQPA
jgi:phosphate:Na+ symporter